MLDEDIDMAGRKARKPKNLEPMSLEDLREYISSLQEEVARAEREIQRKQAHARSADSFFKI